MRNLIVGILILFGSDLYGQDALSNFTGLKAQGSVPVDFIVLSTDKYMHDYVSNQEYTLDKEFFLNTRFLIDELLHSGAVLYGDTLSNYVRKVAIYVLGEESELSKKLRFYVLKSNTPNAFSTDQGIIFITTGLLARLENEGQLAFILAHEISHYTGLHVREGYAKRKSLGRKGYYTQSQYDAVIASMSKYNHSLEFEADLKGIELLKNTDYNSSVILSSFQVLKSSHLPFEDVPFNTFLFDSDWLTVPKNYFPKSKNPFGSFNATDDAESITHPNVDERIEKSEEYLSTNGLVGNALFHFPEEEFYLVRNLARFESINQHLLNRNYTQSIYEISLLQQSFKNLRFLDLSLVKAIYGLVKYKNHNRFKEVTKSYTEVSGEISVLHGFFAGLPKTELNILAYRIAFDMVKKYEGDSVFIDYLNDLKRELIFRSGLSLSDLKNNTCDELEFLRDSVKSIGAIIDTSLNQLPNPVPDVIEDSVDWSNFTLEIPEESEVINVQTDSVVRDPNTMAFALCDIFENDIYRTELEKIRDTEITDTMRDYYSETGWRYKGTEPTGISKVIVVDPVFQYYGLTKGKKLVKSEQRKVATTKHYQSEKNDLDLDIVMLDSKQYNSQSVETYNELGAINAWAYELALHDGLEMISSTSDEVDRIAQKYQTSNFLFSGFYAYEVQHSWTTVHTILSLGFYTIPLLLLDIWMVHNNFEYVTFVINSESEKIDYVKVQEVDMRGLDKTLSLYVYDALYLLSKGK